MFKKNEIRYIYMKCFKRNMYDMLHYEILTEANKIKLKQKENPF